MKVDARSIATALGGEVIGRGQILAPGPGHSARDRSLSIRIEPDAPDGFVVFSHSGDDPMAAKAYVRARLGLSHADPAALPPGRQRECRQDPDEAERTARALAIWREVRSPAGTPVETYLTRRGLPLPEAAIGWHPACPFGKAHVGCMVALVRNIRTNAPQAIHRTALSADGRKIEIDGRDRLTLGPIAGGAIKLTPDERAILALGIGEGIESVLSLQRLPDLSTLPVWSLIAANQVATFPVLGGVECLWLAVDHDPAGVAASATVADRWRDAGREVMRVAPIAPGADMNDLVKGGRDAA